MPGEAPNPETPKSFLERIPSGVQVATSLVAIAGGIVSLDEKGAILAIADSWRMLVRGATALLVLMCIWLMVYRRCARAWKIRARSFDATKKAQPLRAVQVAVWTASRILVFLAVNDKVLIVCLAASVVAARRYFVQRIHESAFSGRPYPWHGDLITFFVVLIVVALTRYASLYLREIVATYRIGDQAMNRLRRPINDLQKEARLWQTVAESSRDQLWIESSNGAEIVGMGLLRSEMPGIAANLRKLAPKTEIRILLADPTSLSVRVRSALLCQTYLEVFAIPFMRTVLLATEIKRQHPNASVLVRLYSGWHLYRTMLSDECIALERYGIVRHVSMQGLFFVRRQVNYKDAIGFGETLAHAMAATADTSVNLPPRTVIEKAYQCVRNASDAPTPKAPHDGLYEMFRSSFQERWDDADAVAPPGIWKNDGLKKFARLCGISGKDLRLLTTRPEILSALCKHLNLGKEFAAAFPDVEESGREEPRTN